MLEFTFLLFFLYHAFHAIRHVFLFVLLAIPIIARELTHMTDTRDNWDGNCSEPVRMASWYDFSAAIQEEGLQMN